MNIDPLEQTKNREMTWTRKHQEFAAKNNWWQSSINIACYLYKKCKASEPTEIEFDSAKFQTYIKRIKGKKYHPTTPRKALINLVEKSQGLVISCQGKRILNFEVSRLGL